MEGPIKKIMVYIDGTEQSITDAQYAICLSRSIGSELIFSTIAELLMMLTSWK